MEDTNIFHSASERENSNAARVYMHLSEDDGASLPGKHFGVSISRCDGAGSEETKCMNTWEYNSTFAGQQADLSK